MTTPTRPPTRGTAFMVLGSLIGAVSAYVFNVIGGRVLGATGFAPISVLWTLFFIVATVALVPVEQQVTRGAASGLKMLTLARLRPALVAIGASAVVGAAFVLLTLERAFEGRWVFAPLASLAFVTFGVYVVWKGLLAGHERYRDYGWALIIESVGRVALAVAFLIVARDSVSLALAMAVCTLLVGVLRPWRHDHPELHPEVLPGMSGGRFLGAYIAGSASSQLLLAGAPLGVLALGGTPEMVSVTFATFTLFRAPLTLIYNLQGRLLPVLTRMAEHGEEEGLARFARRLVGGGVVLAAAGGVAGWLVGPLVVEVLFGGEFRPDRAVAALAAGGVAAASAAQVIGQTLVASGRTGALARAWTIGLAVALPVSIVTPDGPMLRVAAGFAAGELAAFAVMAWSTVRFRSQVEAGSGR